MLFYSIEVPQKKFLNRFHFFLGFWHKKSIKKLQTNTYRTRRASRYTVNDADLDMQDLQPKVHTACSANQMQFSKLCNKMAERFKSIFRRVI